MFCSLWPNETVLPFDLVRRGVGISPEFAPLWSSKLLGRTHKIYIFIYVFFPFLLFLFSLFFFFLFFYTGKWRRTSWDFFSDDSHLLTGLCHEWIICRQKQFGLGNVTDMLKGRNSPTEYVPKNYLSLQILLSEKA